MMNLAFFLFYKKKLQKKLGSREVSSFLQFSSLSCCYFQCSALTFIEFYFYHSISIHLFQNLWERL